MLNVTFITVGDVPRGAFQELREMYTTYLQKYVRMTHRVVKDAESLCDRIADDETVIVLDAGGKPMTSTAFAKTITGYENAGVTITVILGGAYGLPDDIKSRANFLLSLSPMTTTHDLAHLFFLEQLFRAFTIIRGTEYHK